jgi:hypothetical protein
VLLRATNCAIASPAASPLSLSFNVVTAKRGGPAGQGGGGVVHDRAGVDTQVRWTAGYFCYLSPVSCPQPIDY